MPMQDSLDLMKMKQRVQKALSENYRKAESQGKSKHTFEQLKAFADNIDKVAAEELRKNQTTNVKKDINRLNEGNTIRVKGDPSHISERQALIQNIGSDLAEKTRGDMLSTGGRPEKVSKTMSRLSKAGKKGLKAIPFVGPAMMALSALGSGDASAAGELLEDEITDLIPGGIRPLGEGSDEIPRGAQQFKQSPEEFQKIQESFNQKQLEPSDDARRRALDIMLNKNRG